MTDIAKVIYNSDLYESEHWILEILGVIVRKRRNKEDLQGLADQINQNYFENQIG